MLSRFVFEPVDKSRIELAEHFELAYWTREFGCTASELLDAIESVGIVAADVRAHLATRLVRSRPLVE